MLLVLKVLHSTSQNKVYYFLVQAKRSCSALNLILLLLFWSIFVTHFILS